MYRHLVMPLLNIISTDIVFTGDKAVLPSSAINKNYITDFDALTKLGNEFMTDLVEQLGL
jgi:chitosanase